MADTMMIPFQPLCLVHTTHGPYEEKINAKAYGEKRSHFHAGSKEIRALKTELIKRRRTETSWQQCKSQVISEQICGVCLIFQKSNEILPGYLL